MRFDSFYAPQRVLQSIFSRFSSPADQNAPTGGGKDGVQRRVERAAGKTDKP
jgi:hypothetical protein